MNGEDGLWIEAGGCAHLFGGEDALLQDVVRRLAAAGRQRTGCDGEHAGRRSRPGAAWSLRGPAVAAGEEAPSVEALPIAGLRLAPELVIGLGSLGSRRSATSSACRAARWR